MNIQPVFLIFDNAQYLEAKFRVWLKYLVRQRISILLLASNVPKKDVFLNIARIPLKSLPTSAIREIMIKAVVERGLELSDSDLAKLEERVGGNPSFAIKAIEEEQDYRQNTTTVF